MLPLAFAGGGAPLRVLCIGAHSDDIEIGCGGTILRLLSERRDTVVHWVVLSANGTRETEARASAASFLALAAAKTVVTKAFRESYFPAAWSDVKDFFEETRRTFEPTLVFTHHPKDLHQDHRVAGELTWNTFRNHLILEYEIPKYEGDLGSPNCFVPLTRAQAERKVEFLMEHFGSQATRSWFRADTFHGLMSVRGIECLAPEARAEAFHARKVVL